MEHNYTVGMMVCISQNGMRGVVASIDNTGVYVNGSWWHHTAIMSV